jgi:hypothetical protein
MRRKLQLYKACDVKSIGVPRIVLTSLVPSVSKYLIFTPYKIEIILSQRPIDVK